MDKVKWGIIGCGDVCERKSGPAFYKAKHSSLEAVMRRDRAKAEDFARRHGVARAYGTAAALIADPDVDIVYVATPPSTHKEYALEVLRAGKPVYVEKPMALNHAQCLEMTEAARRAGRELFVAYYRRALPYFLKVKELLDGGAIGRLSTVEARFFRAASPEDSDPARWPWRLKKEIAGEGYFFDMAPHTLDILDFLFGPVTEVSGGVSNTAGLYGVADTVCTSFRFGGGALGSGMWNFVCPSGGECDRVTVTGTGGQISFSVFSFDPIILTDASGSKKFTPPQPEHIQQPLIETIIAQLRGEGECPSTGESATRTAWVMDRIVAL